MRFATLTRMADQLMTYKYVVKNVARRAGKTATFMPKPLFGDNGSGMHCHQSLWKDGKTLMADDDGLRRALGDRPRTTSAASSRTPPRCSRSARRRRTPTAGSCPGYEAPVNLVYSQRNRSACVRIPMYSSSPKAKRIEFRCPDPTANPYLAFSAMLLAGLDGIEKGLDPGAPSDYDLFEESQREVAQVPGSLAESLDALEADHAFLLKGGVFSEELIDDLDRLEADERGRRRPAAAPPGRVRPLLRRLGRARAGGGSPARRRCRPPAAASGPGSAPPTRFRAMRYVFVDCRWALDDPGFGRAAYEQGHIPGAAFLDVERDLAAPAGRRGRHPLPAADDFARAAGRRGHRRPTPSSSPTGRSAAPSGSGGCSATSATTACAVIDLDGLARAARRRPRSRSSRRASSPARAAGTRSSSPSSPPRAAGSSSSTRACPRASAASRTRSTRCPAASRAPSTRPGTNRCRPCRRASSSPTAAPGSPRASSSTASTCAAARGASTRARGPSGSSTTSFRAQRG